jgi:hypothetical protein
MTRINMNNMARDVTLIEGKKISLPIGQVKEVLKIFLRILANDYSVEEVNNLLKKYKNK